MASGDLVKRPQLDSSGIEEGAQKAAKALGSLKKYSELAEKGLKSLGNADGLKNIKDKFSDLSRQIDKFSTKMNNGLNIKQQKKQIELQLDEVAAAYRSLSKEEQSSAEGKWLKNYMNELTVMGGKAADTIQDMNKQINAMASDTPILAGLAEATSLVTNGFTIAKGAAHLLGMDEKELAKVQKELTSLMAINNAVMNIKNALVNQGAIKTALLNIKIKSNVILTELQTAAAGKATIATKAVAAAQVLWNKAIKANPIIFVAGIIIAAVAALVKLTSSSNAASEAAKRHAEEEKKRREEIMRMANAVADSIGKQLGLFTMLEIQWKKLQTVYEKNQWIRDNQKAFEELGLSIKGINDAEEAFNKNTKNIIQAMWNRAMAAAHYAEIERAASEKIRKDETARLTLGNENRYKAGETVSAALAKNLKEGTEKISYNIPGKPEAILLQAGADKLNATATSPLLDAALDANKRVFRAAVEYHATEIAKLGGLEFTGGTTTTTPKTTPKATPTNEEKKAVENSLAWYDEQISKRKEQQLKFTVNHEDWKNLQDEINDFEKRKILKQIELEYGGFREALGSVSKGFENAAITGLKSPEISKVLTGITMPNWEEINADAATKKMDEILKKTEGLRMVANAAGEAFGALGKAIGDNTAGKVVDFAGMIASSIAIMVEGYARATAAAGKLSPWAWLAFGLTGAAQLAAMIAQVRSFDTGGIVGGNGSFSAYNDGIVLRAHQGEMMLNKQQQRKLFDSINGGLDRTHNGNVKFTIKGKELVGVLNNYEQSFARTR